MNLKWMDYHSKNWLNAILSFSVLILCLLFLFFNTFVGIVSIWIRSETFTHGFLVIPIVIWLIWRKRDLIYLENPSPNFWILIPIFFVCLIWLLGDLVSINSITQLAVIALVVLIVFSVFGWAVASVIIFPLSFLFFSVPLGEFLLPILMEWTAKFTVLALRFSGVPVYQEGLQFVISSGSWSVVEACSGVRYLISSLMIGTLYAYLSYKSLKKRFIFICFSIVIPVLANWIRAYFIVMLGHISGNRLAVGFDHLIYGWLFFGLVIMLMFLLGGRWAENSVSDVHVSNFTVVAAVKYSLKSSAYFYVVIGIIFSLVIPRVWGNLISSKNNLDYPILSLPVKLSDGWSKISDNSLDFKSGFHGASTEINSTYGKQSSKIGLYIAYYRNQSYENKLISSNNKLFNPKDKSWLELSRVNEIIRSGDDVFPVRTSTWRSSGVDQHVGEIRLQTWQFYWVNGLFIESDYKAKILGAIQRLLANGDDSAVVIIYANDDNLAHEYLEDFLRKNSSEIKKILEKTRTN